MQLAPALRNRLVVQSLNDRIEGFTTGVLATGGRRFFAEPLNPPPTDNHIDLQLIGTTIVTPSCVDADSANSTDNPMGVPVVRRRTVADLRFTGSEATIDRLHPGDRNSIRVELRNVTGSGARSNRFLDEGGPSGVLAPQFRGRGNRLEFVGDPQSFAKANRTISPAPGAKFFPKGDR